MSSLVIDVLSTLLIVFFQGQIAWNTFQVWFGPYEEKGMFALKSIACILGLAFIAFGVWF